MCSVPMGQALPSLLLPPHAKTWGLVDILLLLPGHHRQAGAGVSSLPVGGTRSRARTRLRHAAGCTHTPPTLHFSPFFWAYLQRQPPRLPGTSWAALGTALTAYTTASPPHEDISLLPGTWFLKREQDGRWILTPVPAQPGHTSSGWTLAPVGRRGKMIFLPGFAAWWVDGG